MNKHFSNIKDFFIQHILFIKNTIKFLFVLIVISALAYNSFTINKISNELNSLKIDTASTTARLDSNIIKTYSDLSETINNQKLTVGEIASRLGSYQQEVGSITNTVSTLQKLSKIDPELLSKYSKVFFLNENYAPARLVEVPKEYSYTDTKTLKIMTDVWPKLKLLIDDAKVAGVDVFIYSGYRSFDEQSAIKGQYSVTYGAGTANQFSADQGYSEHQLGTTVDFMTKGIGGSLSGFDGTKAYEWLTANAHRYGFTLSYPKGNAFYIYEPWHWRYVGETLATELYNTNQHFYDLDQRKIDQYLITLF